jgi:hypothetical protein
MKLLFEYQLTKAFDINKIGIQLIEYENSIEIYNDPFRTVPLFVTKDDAGELIIFSKYEDYYKFEMEDRIVDQAGFWEIVLFGSTLWTRTLHKKVEQMAAAMCLKVDKQNEKYSFKCYWSYDVVEDRSIQSLEQAADGMYLVLDSIFSSLNKKEHYLLGMSGGLDSRITLAFLSRHIPESNIKLFTYGFNEKILEYVYAKAVAVSLGIAVPDFHPLTMKSYKDALEYLPSMSGGQISINHCHILDYMINTELHDYRHISTYYSDALFGYDCTYPKRIETIEKNYYAEAVSAQLGIPPEIRKVIIDDSYKIFSRFDTESNFSSLSEFKYVTERNQKFHMYLASLQGSLVSTDVLYANMKLLRFALSIPLKYRQNKKIIDALLLKYFPEISSRDFKNISSRDFRSVTPGFQWGSKISGLANWYLFRFLNRVNSVLRVITGGTIQFFNKYQTEEHERHLYSEFKDDLLAATAKFVEMGIMSAEQKIEFDRLPVRNTGVAERYALISMAKII